METKLLRAIEAREIERVGGGIATINQDGAR